MTSVFSEKTPLLRGKQTGRLLIIALCLIGGLLWFSPALAQKITARDAGTPMVGPARDMFEVQVDWPDACPPVVEEFQYQDGRYSVFSRSQDDCRSSSGRLTHMLPFMNSRTDTSQIYWYFRDDESRPYQLFGFTLLPPRHFERSLSPESGWWWTNNNTSFATSPMDNSLTLDIQNDHLTAIVHRFEEGQPVWLVAAGTLEKQSFSAPLLRLNSPPVAPGNVITTEAIPTGEELILQFHSATTADAWLLNRLSNQLSTPLDVVNIPLTRYISEPDVSRQILVGEWLITTASAEQSLHTRIEIADIQAISNDRVVLLGVNEEPLGECELQSTLKNDNPPQLCRLYAIPQFGIVEWNDFGIGRLSGNDLMGNQLLGFRISPN